MASPVPAPPILVTPQPWWRSRTLLTAALQAIGGVAVLFIANQHVAWPVAIGTWVKSFVDVYLRLTTATPIIGPLAPATATPVAPA